MIALLMAFVHDEKKMTVVMCLGPGLKNINYLKPSLKKKKKNA